MKLPVLLSLCLLVGFSAGFRGNSQRGASSISSSQSNQLNIGLIAPHTNFGEFLHKFHSTSAVQLCNPRFSRFVSIFQLCNNKIFIRIFIPSFYCLGKREYLRAINSAVTGLSKWRGQKLTFLKDYEFNPANIHFESLTLNPSPTAILNILCKQFLHANVSAILYMMNYEQYGRSTASAQYFLQVINL